MRNAIRYVLLVLMIAAAGGFFYERIAAARDRETWPPPGRILTIDGIDMHLDCRGAGEPAVILEAGLMSGSSTWIRVHDRLAEHTLTCSYDRPQMDWSGDGPFNPHVEGVAGRLHKLLDAAALTGPRIMVGMSAGGVYVREYVARHPEGVVGMVLVDSSHESQASRLPATGEIERLESLLTICSALQPFGVVRLTNALDPFLTWYQLPKEEFDLFKAMYYKPGRCAAIANESKSFTEDLGRNLTPRSLGDLPLLVISQGKAPEANAASGTTLEQAREFSSVWDALQQELVALSTRSERVLATKSGHVIQLEQPDIVVAGIVGMVNRVRADTTGPAEEPADDNGSR